MPSYRSTGSSSGFSRQRAIPGRFPRRSTPTAWRIDPSEATSILTDGDRIELGGRTLTVLHTPGHSPDGISLLEEREGLLFADDAFNAGSIYAHFPDSDVDALDVTARRLSDLAGDVKRIFTHHYGRPLADVGFSASTRPRRTRSGLTVRRSARGGTC
jgi:glyoxylase-like metal-dependent hydrolase (beta-lactamase superfamily II)